MKPSPSLSRSRRTGLIPAAILALLTACRTPEVKPDARLHADAAPAGEESLRAGVAAFNAGKLPEAVGWFEKAVEKDPRAASARYSLALSYERTGQLSKAQAAYEALLELAPDHRAAMLSLGRVYRMQDQAAQAVAWYERVARAPGQSDDVELLNALSAAYRAARDFPRAEATARRVLARAEGNLEAQKNLALIYYDQGSYLLAELMISSAMKLSEKDPGVYNTLGLIYLKLEDLPGAIAQFRKAVELDARFAPALLNLGALSLSYRDFLAAEKSFAQARSADPYSHESHLYYAYALDAQRGRDARKGVEAGAAFEAVLQLRPEQPEAVCGAGRAYSAEAKTWGLARRYLEECLRKNFAQGAERRSVELQLEALVARQKSENALAPTPANDKVLH